MAVYRKYIILKRMGHLRFCLLIVKRKIRSLWEEHIENLLNGDSLIDDNTIPSVTQKSLEFYQLAAP